MATLRPTANDTRVPQGSAIGVLTEDGLRVLVDSEALAQAVYLYRPVLADDGTVIDLQIEAMNSAAHRVPLSSAVVEGVLASEVFVDTAKAFEAATVAWRGGRAPRYEIERRGLVGGQPTIVQYEVSTFRMGDHVVQVSVDHSTSIQLASADARFRLMSDASNDGLVLVARDHHEDRFVVVYANPAAFVDEPEIRVGRPLPDGLDVMLLDAVADLGAEAPVRRLLGGSGVSRRIDREVFVTAIADDQVMLTIRHLTPSGIATADLERSERVLAAIGAGAFGTIAVFEPRYTTGRLVGLERLWQSRRSDGGDAGLTEAMPVDELVAIAASMLEAGEHQRSGWVQVPGDDGVERSVEFTLVLAGDRFVLEFVERTEELAARTALAMVNATSEAQRTFLSRVSHEMRSPLNVINGYSQLLRRLQLPAAAVDHLARIEDGIERMVHIVDDLLLLGQLDQGLLRLDLQLVDVGEVAVEIVERASAASWWRSGSLCASTADARATVRTDRTRFVAVGLLLAEASVAVCTEAPVEVGTFVRGTKVGLLLTAPAECPVADEVWRPFADSHVIPGDGLGLAVARGLVQALGLTVEVRSLEGRSSLLLLLDPVGEPSAGALSVVAP